MPTKPISPSSEPEFQNLTRNYSFDETLATGERIRIRAARPDDRERLLDHLQHLSPESLRSRFFATKGDFTEELVQLAGADFANVVVLLATVQGPGNEQVKGVAAYALLQPSSSVAELAITVTLRRSPSRNRHFAARASDSDRARSRNCRIGSDRSQSEPGGTCDSGPSGLSRRKLRRP